MCCIYCLVVTKKLVLNVEYNKLWIIQVHTVVTDNDKLHVPLYKNQKKDFNSIKFKLILK